MQSISRTAAPVNGTEDGVWPVSRRAVLDWLVNETRTQRFIDNILVELGQRLVAANVPVARCTLHFRIQHPQWRGARILWRPGLTEADIDMFDYGVETTSQFLNSPANEIFNGAPEVRQNLAADNEAASRYALFRDLRAEGLTDYVAWPIDHTLGKRHIVTFSTDRPEGFDDQHIQCLRDLVPALALVSEIRLKNAMARTLLQTYVGPHASEKILAGATTRGSGATVSAAIMICDLRDFTAISDLWPRDDVIEMLNGYFDAMSEPIETHGGEILKFMGDGLLAIFPLTNPSACVNLLKAIREGQEAMSALNEKHEGNGRPKLRYGVGAHVGDVMYGNIGSRKRLDFTAIGPVVNIASRLEALTKEIKRPVLLSKAFADLAGFDQEVERVGSYLLRGLEEPVEVFALKD
jgi:adenylate cyclase